MTTYNVLNMRAVVVSGKMAEKHPDRWLTIHGEFFTEDGNPLSFTSKDVTFEDAKNAEFSIDLDAGILTLVEGQRGRPKVEGISQEDLLASLEELRAEA